MSIRSSITPLLIIPSQVQSNDRAQGDDYEERQPSLQEATKAHILPTDEHPSGQVDHVVVGLVPILHVLQRCPHMRMAVVAEEVVHSRTVQHRCLGHCLVPFMSTTLHEHWVQGQIPCGPGESHVVLGHMIGTGKVSDNTRGHGDAHVSNKREEPSEDRDRSPDQTEWVPVCAEVDHGLGATVAVYHIGW